MVRIYFPAAEIQATKGEKLRIELAKGTGTILIMGDEEPVIDVTMAILEKLGYRILRRRAKISWTELRSDLAEPIE